MIRFFSHLPAYERRITISTVLTLVRIGLVPVMAWWFVQQRWSYFLVLLAGAAITDVLDGWLARVRGEQTALGAILDPLADKLLTVTLFAAGTYIGVISPYFCLFCIIKEVVQIVGACVWYRDVKTPVISALWLGKMAMVAQVMLLAWVVGGAMAGWHLEGVNSVAQLCVAILMALALVQYGIVAYRSAAE